MGTNIRIRMAGRGLLAAAALAGLASLGVAAPATASSFTAPGIHSLSPAHGAAGTTVRITGSGFTRVTAVRFAGVAAAFKVRSGSKITAVVPAMPSAAGRVTVTTRTGTATSRARFTVTSAVVVSAVTGPPGSAVAVSGTGFGALEGVDVFVDTTDRALAGTGPAGSFGPVQVTIPASAIPGTHWISAEGRRSRLFAQAPFAVNTDWAQFGYSASHDGTNLFENVLSVSSVARLDRAWNFPDQDGGLFPPTTAGGLVYVGGDDGKLHALTAATGAKRWSFTTGPSINSAPAVAGGLVYLASARNGLYALNAATGTKRWSFTTGDIAESSPAVAGGVVYIASDKGIVYALNAATGAKLWSFRTRDLVESSPAVAAGVVYIATFFGTVYALDAATGAKRWSFTITGGGVPFIQHSSPAVGNGVLYIGTSTGLDALNAATGALLWTFATSNVVDSTPAVAGGLVYIGAEDGNVYALDAATGAKRWTFTTGFPVFCDPAVANGVVYTGTSGSVVALNAATGTRLWSFTTGGSCLSSPAVADGVVYIGSGGGGLDAYALPGGLTTPARPTQNNLHPDHSLRPQR